MKLSKVSELLEKVEKKVDYIFKANFDYQKNDYLRIDCQFE